MTDQFHYPSADECPDVKKHTVKPRGYLAWHEWAEQKSKTHDCERCPTCGFWAIWRRKTARGLEEGT